MLSIQEIQKKAGIPADEIFKPADSGTHHKVFLSPRYVIRVRSSESRQLLREADFLKTLNHPLIPKVLWAEMVGEVAAMVEYRLPGNPLNVVWRSLTPEKKERIVSDVVDFLKYLRMQKREQYYSVSTGKYYINFFQQITDSVEQKLKVVERFKQAQPILEQVKETIYSSDRKDLLRENQNIAVVHGDLIIHNLLSDGERLTGVLDWELGMYSNSDFDLFRLWYYRECAKAYYNQGTDETFEFDYMERLTQSVIAAGIDDPSSFEKDYRFVRALFYLNAFFWAVNSDNPSANVAELVRTLEIK